MTKTPATETSDQVDQLGLPLDLREWVSEKQLLEWIGTELLSIDWKDPNVVEFEQKHPQFRPKMFTTLLTYAYSTGLFSSEDIPEGCYRDEILRTISEGNPPNGRAIVAFRRENRGLLQSFLMELFKQAIK